MTGLRRALGLVAIEGIVVGLVALAIVLSSDHVDAEAFSAALGLFLGWSWIGVGLFAWWRRPDNRFGVLMTAVGFAFFLSVLTAADSQLAVHDRRAALEHLPRACSCTCCWPIPTGGSTRRGMRRLLVGAYALAIIGPAPIADVRRHRQHGLRDCPDSAIFDQRQPHAVQDPRRHHLGDRGDPRRLRALRAGPALAGRRRSPSAGRWRPCCGRASACSSCSPAR